MEALWRHVDAFTAKIVLEKQVSLSFHFSSLKFKFFDIFLTINFVEFVSFAESHDDEDKTCPICSGKRRKAFNLNDRN